MERNFPSADQMPPQVVKARFKKEIAEEMGYSVRTLQRRLKEAGIEIPRGLISPEKQLEIFQTLGWEPAPERPGRNRQFVRSVRFSS